MHVYGGDPNSASVIGLYGNPFLDYVAAFDLRAQNAPAPTVNFKSGAPCHYYSIPTSKTPDVIKAPIDLTSGAFAKFTAQQGFTQSGFNSTGFQPVSKSFARPTEASRRRAINGTTPTRALKPYNNVQTLTIPTGCLHDEEGFMDIFDTALKIGGPILSGIGGPIGCLANVALSTAGSVARSLGAEGAIEQPSTVSSAPEGTVERAVLAEAALRAVLEMDEQTLEEEGLLDIMKSVVKTMAPVVKETAPKVLEVVGSAALKLAVDALKGNNTNGAEGFCEIPTNPATTRPIVRLTHLSTTGQDAFVQRVAAATEADAEGFLDGLMSVGSFVAKGFQTVAPVLADVAKVGLPLLLGGRAESEVVGPEPTPMQAMDGIWQRAVVAEAALQAVLQVPQDVLEEEGFFSSIGEHLKSVASVVTKYAPDVIKVVTPVVKNLMGGQESAIKIDRPQTPHRLLRKARSGASLRSSTANDAHGEFWGRAKALNAGMGVAY